MIALFLVPGVLLVFFGVGLATFESAETAAVLVSGGCVVLAIGFAAHWIVSSLKR